MGGTFSPIVIMPLVLLRLSMLPESLMSEVTQQAQHINQRDSGSVPHQRASVLLG